MLRNALDDVSVSKQTIEKIGDFKKAVRKNNITIFSDILIIEKQSSGVKGEENHVFYSGTKNYSKNYSWDARTL